MFAADLRKQFAHAYARCESLTVGFDGYRAMPADAKHNAKVAHITTRLLYVHAAGEFARRQAMTNALEI